MDVCIRIAVAVAAAAVAVAAAVALALLALAVECLRTELPKTTTLPSSLVNCRDFLQQKPQTNKTTPSTKQNKQVGQNEKKKITSKRDGRESVGIAEKWMLTDAQKNTKPKKSNNHLAQNTKTTKNEKNLKKC